MKSQLLAAFVLILAVTTSAVQAGPVFTLNAANPSGTSSGYPNTYYGGLNDFSGTIDTSAPYGVIGNNTTLHNGGVFGEAAVTFSVNGSSGTFDIIGSLGYDLTGTVVTSGVSSSGGSFTFVGTMSTAFDTYFGLDAGTTVAGTATIRLSTSASGNASLNDTGTLSLTFSPAFVPEPSSVVMLGTGVFGLMAALVRQRSRA